MITTLHFAIRFFSTELHSLPKPQGKQIRQLSTIETRELEKIRKDEERKIKPTTTKQDTTSSPQSAHNSSPSPKRLAQAPHHRNPSPHSHNADMKRAIIRRHRWRGAPAVGKVIDDEVGWDGTVCCVGCKEAKADELGAGVSGVAVAVTVANGKLGTTLGSSS
ncbi:hypothetical protein G7Y89_g15852 [Cudoniella acicularis]|uniref:Uncharacterized protein n=1 Tax=Cudoniella acicularis TaxID=354080 RepID=A0A8H4VIT0_9HELO|nr:hypothetical protein G7Y89_g15852 [Cudoniella acicularis]